MLTVDVYRCVLTVDVYRCVLTVGVYRCVLTVGVYRCVLTVGVYRCVYIQMVQIAGASRCVSGCVSRYLKGCVTMQWPTQDCLRHREE